MGFEARWGGVDDLAWVEFFKLISPTRRPHRGRPTEAKTESGSGFDRAVRDNGPYRAGSLGRDVQLAARPMVSLRPEYRIFYRASSLDLVGARPYRA